MSLEINYGLSVSNVKFSLIEVVTTSLVCELTLEITREMGASSGGIEE
jgi:hypothetical protein